MSDEPVVQKEEEVDPFALFPEEIREPVQGLTYLGQLTETVHFCGHTFGLRTLRPADKFAIGMVLQPYRNTIHEVDAYQAAHIGMALTAVDGDCDFCPAIGPDIEAFARARLNYITQGPQGNGGWYPPTVEFLWGRYVLLEATAVKAIQALDRLTQGGQQNSSPWLGSLIGQGNSPDKIALASQPSTPSN